MVRNYVRRNDARRYLSYTKESLEEAYTAVLQGCSIREAARTYDIAYGTLRNKLNNYHSRAVGGQKQLTQECEREIVKSINILSEWRVPVL